MPTLPLLSHYTSGTGFINNFPFTVYFVMTFSQTSTFIISNEVEILFSLLTLKNEQNYIGFSSF